MNTKVDHILKTQNYQKVEQFIQQRYKILVCWLSGHSNLEGNKKADLAIKNTVRGEKIQTAKWTSLTQLRK